MTLYHFAPHCFAYEQNVGSHYIKLSYHFRQRESNTDDSAVKLYSATLHSSVSPVGIRNNPVVSQTSTRSSPRSSYPRATTSASVSPQRARVPRCLDALSEQMPFHVAHFALTREDVWQPPGGWIYASRKLSQMKAKSIAYCIVLLLWRVTCRRTQFISGSTPLVLIINRCRPRLLEIILKNNFWIIDFDCLEDCDCAIPFSKS